MSVMTIKLNHVFTTRQLEAWEAEEFAKSVIDEVGLVLEPIDKKNGDSIGFELPFMCKSFKKKTGTFTGSLIEGNSKYQLSIDGEMEVKLRPGVENMLNQAEGGFEIKAGFIARKGKESGRIIVELDGQERGRESSWVDIRDFHIV